MNKEIFTKFPTLETERLILREMNQNDLEGVFKFNSSIKNLKYVAREPYVNLQQAQEKLNSFRNGFYNKESIWWTFTFKNSDELIGYGGLFELNFTTNKAEIGYGLLNDYWGKGIMSEAVNALVDFGFNQLELNKIYGKIVPGNLASEKILLKLNFKKEGVLIADEFARDKYFDMAVFARIR